MSTLSPEPATAVEPAVQDRTERPVVSPMEFFLRGFAVVAGIGLGAIVALFVALNSGWMQFC